MEFKKAERCKAKLRLAITGPSGSGKTYSALLIAQGLGGKVVMIDTENGSGNLYASDFDYDIGVITAPYDVRKYISAIHESEEAGYDVIIIDSLSHAWAGEGGLLDMQGKIADNSSSMNTWAAWRQVTPWHNRLLETILTSQCHVIATMRSKTEYAVIENEKGKKEPRKIGLAPVQRDGIEYEFTTVFDLNNEHIATVSKDRTNIFDGQFFLPSADTGAMLKKWLDTGVDVKPRKVQQKELWERYLKIADGNAEEAKNLMWVATGKMKFSDCTEADIEALINDISRREQGLA